MRMESTGGGEGGKTTDCAVLRLAGSQTKKEVLVCLGNTIVVGNLLSEVSKVILHLVEMAQGLKSHLNFIFKLERRFSTAQL